MIMRNLARNVMKNVRLRNTICGVCADPGHDRATVSKKAAIQSGQGTTRECELRGAVMGEERVGMLEEGD